MGVSAGTDQHDDLHSVFSLEQNLGDIGDTRLDTTNDVAVRVSDRIALKVSLQLQFTSQPALIDVGVVTEGGEDAGFSVSVPARHLCVAEPPEYSRYSGVSAP